MPPRPSHHQKLLRLLRHLLVALGDLIGVRMAALRARRDALPKGHKRRAVLEKELRRIGWAQAMLADLDLPEDAAFRGMAAERARVFADAGRRALVRRMIWPTPLWRLRGAVPAAGPRAEEGRCTGARAVGLALPGGFPGGGGAACTLNAGIAPGGVTGASSWLGGGLDPASVRAYDAPCFVGYNDLQGC